MMDMQSRNQLGEDKPSTSDEGAKLVEIECQSQIYSVAFLADGTHIVSGDRGRTIRCWRGKDGNEAGAPMDAEGKVYSITISKDGKRLVAGTDDGFVRVWDVQSHEKLAEFKAHDDRVFGVDVSPDGMKIASGSADDTVGVWSLSSGERLLGPLKYDHTVGGVKFSPDGQLIAIAAWSFDSIWIYDSQEGRLLVNAPVQVNSVYNQSLAWARDSKELFALSRDGEIHRLDTSTGKTLSVWSIHDSNDPTCIALASNGMFLAASAGSSISFWDTSTHDQIGPVIEHPGFVECMGISDDCEIVIGGGKTITLRGLLGLLPSSYVENQTTSASEKNCDGESSNTDVTRLETAHQERGLEHEAHQQTNRKSESLDRTINILRTDLGVLAEHADDKIMTLLKTVQDLRRGLGMPANQKEESLSSIAASLETMVQQLHIQLAESRQKVDERDNLIQIRQLRTLLTEFKQGAKEEDGMAQIVHAHERKHHCEALYSAGRVLDAALFLIEIANGTSNDVRGNELPLDWLTEFTGRCTLTLEKIGDDASNAEDDDQAIAAFSAILCLGSSASNNILIKWVTKMMIRSSVKEILHAAAKFKHPLTRFDVYRVLCDVLEHAGRIDEAIACHKEMQNESAADTSTSTDEWELGFQRRCAEKLEKLADDKMKTRKHDTTIEDLSAALSLKDADRMDILIKRSKTYALMESWDDALCDADEAIKLDPASHEGYERRHAALHGAGRHKEAVEAFDMILSKIDQSPDEDIHKLHSQYTDARPTIRRIVKQTLRQMPGILIDTTTGNLYDKSQQAEAFEDLPIWSELVSSMTREIDYAWIGIAVKEFYRYVMLSHTWEHNEPRLQKVKNMSIYDLEPSPTHIKLQKFCELVRHLGFHWAWADTTCIDQKDNVVLHESLVAMFTWYRGSSLTIVYLRGVLSASRITGGLRRSRWNTRGWTYQEYVAAETIQFYTEDWKPYLNLDIFNHKESPVIVSEMQQATGVSAEDMAVLRPGLDRIREKLFVASTRETTRMEDTAYSLLGIFGVSIPVIYGEGDRAVGRLLEHILTGSGDVSILAWTGNAGSHNSCLPVDLTVYDELLAPHIPRTMEVVEMDKVMTALRSSLPDLSSAITLYSELRGLPTPSLASSRLRLACIICPVTLQFPIRYLDPVTKLAVYRATTSLYGDIEIKTTDKLDGMQDLYLIHPWIRPLLQQESPRRGGGRLDKATHVLRFLARLLQPFGAILLDQVSLDEYRRVATDSLIMVQLRKDVPLAELSECVETIDIQ